MLPTLFPESFSPSTLEDLARCEFFFFRKHIQRFIGFPRSHHLIAGGLVAKACEMVRKDYYLNKLSLQEALLNVEEFILGSEDTGSFEKSNEDVVRVIKNYFRKYPLNDYFVPIPLPDGSICVEYKFHFDLGIKHPELDKNILFTGILDLLGQIDIPGIGKQTIIVDEKTTTKIARKPNSKLVDIEKEETYFVSSGQFMAYVKACNLLGINIDAVVVRRIPFNKDYEEPFEFTIPVSKYSSNTWFISLIAKIEHLKEQYLKYINDNRDLPELYFFQDFAPVSCNAYFSICPFLNGCIYKEKEKALDNILIQGIMDKETREIIPLTEYRKSLGL